MRLVIVGGHTPSAPLEVVIDAIEAGKLDTEIVGIISVKQDADLVTLAQRHHIPLEIVTLPPLSHEGYYDQAFANTILAHAPDLILLFGYTRIVSPDFIAQWPDRIINIHGAISPKYAGHIGEDTQKMVLEAGDKQAGCTVHIVTEAVDAGSVLAQGTVDVAPNDTPTSLRNKILGVAGDACVEAIKIMQSRA